MASISIGRRRQAWAKGVVAGATGQRKCDFAVPKLIQIYEAGVKFGRDNPGTPEVKAIVARELQKRAPKAPAPPKDRFRGRPTSRGANPRFGRPGRRMP